MNLFHSRQVLHFEVAESLNGEMCWFLEENPKIIFSIKNTPPSIFCHYFVYVSVLYKEEILSLLCRLNYFSGYEIFFFTENKVFEFFS